MKYESIRAELLADGAVLRLVLDKPKGNVLTMAMMGELRHALAAHRDERGLKMVLLRGAGGTFSFGASVPEHRKDTAPAMLKGFHELIEDVATYPVPVVALVEGRCLGGAFELALACHVVFATRGAVFACPEVKLGAIPPVLAVLGHHRLPQPLAERMLLTGEEMDAVLAHEIEWVAAIAPLDVDPEHFVMDWYARSLAPLSSLVLREATLAARRGSGIVAALGAPLQAIERRYVDALLPSHDASEGIEAFLAKRAPKWEGR